jgi:hypothetical protein
MDTILGTTTNALLLIITVVAVIMAASALLFPWLRRKGINTTSTLHVAEGVLSGADTITDILKAAFPLNPIAAIADKIIDYAKIGVAKAEQLYIIDTITGPERNAEAKQFVYDALANAGIERTAAIDKIIDGAVEAAVLMLGHEPKPPDNAMENDNGAENYEGYGEGIAT